VRAVLNSFYQQSEFLHNMVAIQPIVGLLPLLFAPNNMGIFQNLQVMGDGWPTDAKMIGDLADIKLPTLT
jgi:hypothetical protein